METAFFVAMHEPGTLDSASGRRMLRRMQSSGIALIPVTEMTVEEFAPDAAAHGLRRGMIVEAGGAIARWRERAWEVEPCGASADALLEVVSQIEERTGASLYVYSATDESERRYSEPFVIESGSLTAIRRAASRLGFAVRQGHRFLHLRRVCDQGEAFSRLREELDCDIAVAVGSSPIDAEFLTRADVPIIVPRADGIVDPELLSSVPAARVATGGWAEAVDEVLRSGITAQRPRIRRMAS